MLTTTYVLMAGLPGTGKSTLADALARELNGVVLSKDAVRAALFAGRLTDYSREQDDLCFRMVLDAAAYLAVHRRVEFIFLDGRTFSGREQVNEAIGAAVASGCEWKMLLTVCPEAVAEARLVADKGSHPAANRTVELYREVRGRFEPIERPHLELETSRPMEECVKAALGYLRDRI